jgi:predicted Kef-type K+ transport protein
MDPLWIVAAFFFGTIVARLSQPPLVGYLVAGFVLNSFGIEGGQTLQDIANAGVTLLLFTIGLKLKIKSLIRPEVWAGATIHMVLTVADGVDYACPSGSTNQPVRRPAVAKIGLSGPHCGIGTLRR